MYLDTFTLYFNAILLLLFLLYFVYLCISFCPLLYLLSYLNFTRIRYIFDSVLTHLFPRIFPVCRRIWHAGARRYSAFQSHRGFKKIYFTHFAVNSIFYCFVKLLCSPQWTPSFIALSNYCAVRTCALLWAIACLCGEPRLTFSRLCQVDMKWNM